MPVLCLTDGCWKRGHPIGHPRVPGRCAETCHHADPVKTQPIDLQLPRQRSTLDSFRGRLPKGPRGCFMSFSPAWRAKAKKAVGRRSGPGTSGAGATRNCLTSSGTSTLRSELR